MISKRKPTRRTKACKATTAIFTLHPRACDIDRLADIHLQMGHQTAADMLARWMVHPAPSTEVVH